MRVTPAYEEPRVLREVPFFCAGKSGDDVCFERLCELADAGVSARPQDLRSLVGRLRSGMANAACLNWRKFVTCLTKNVDYPGRFSVGITPLRVFNHAQNIRVLLFLDFRLTMSDQERF